MGFYRALGRPLLFLLPPETAHRATATALRLPLPWAALAGAVPPRPTDLAGLSLSVPIGLAAGFDKNASMVEGLAKLGFGYLVVGTVSREPRKGNPAPRIQRVPGDHALVNAMGIPNDGVMKVAARLASRRTATPVVASIADEDPQDVAMVHEVLEPHVDAFELNVSSPNSPWRHSGRDNEAHLREVLAAIGGRTRRPLFIKLPPFDPADGQAGSLRLARIGAEAGVTGFTCANTWPVEAPDLPRGRGGLSGGPLTDATPRMVEALLSAVPGAIINACGGVMDAEGARRCLDAGATTVQLYTALIYEGPAVVRHIASGLAGNAFLGDDVPGKGSG